MSEATRPDGTTEARWIATAARVLRVPRREVVRSARRLRSRLFLIVQAALGAGLAWWLATALLGHPLPFFAPVTAMVCLGLTYGNRVKRVVELTIGVAIGVAVGDLFVHVFGSGIWQIAAVAMVAMSLAVLAGAGQLLMLQAGIQGVIVATLVTGDGQALGRWLDAVVGGAVALVIAMLAPTSRLVRRPRNQAIQVLAHVARVLGLTAQALRERDETLTSNALQQARALQGELDDLRDSATEGLAATSMSPLRRRYRVGVKAIDALVEPLDLAIRDVRVLVRRADVAIVGKEFVPETYIILVEDLAMATSHISDQLAIERVPTEAREDLVNLARSSTWSRNGAGLSAEVMRAQVRSTVVDLLVLTGMSRAEARKRVPPTRDDLDDDPEASERDD
ncbi:FUSC family protein [Ornithinimicrobium sp. Arc0846-15]|nr:FUSC family protein [Ornithinimicrobium laminariae]